MIDDQKIQHIAKLARLEITKEEGEQLKDQLAAILKHFEALNELDTSGVEPMKHVIDTKNVLRDDEVRPSLPQDQALRNAPKQDGQHFIVPGVFDD